MVESEEQRLWGKETCGTPISAVLPINYQNRMHIMCSPVPQFCYLQMGCHVKGA